MIFELLKKLGINKDVINDFLCDVNLIKENQNGEIFSYAINHLLK